MMGGTKPSLKPDGDLEPSTADHMGVKSDLNKEEDGSVTSTTTPRSKQEEDTEEEDQVTSNGKEEADLGTRLAENHEDEASKGTEKASEERRKELHPGTAASSDERRLLLLSAGGASVLLLALLPFFLGSPEQLFSLVAQECAGVNRPSGQGVSHDCPDRAAVGETCAAWCEPGFSCATAATTGITASCREPFVCKSNGAFEGRSPLCRKDCGRPSLGPEYALRPQHTEDQWLPAIPQSAKHNTGWLLSCAEGYQKVGEEGEAFVPLEVRCEDGEWNLGDLSSLSCEEQGWLQQWFR